MGFRSWWQEKRDQVRHPEKVTPPHMRDHGVYTQPQQTNPPAANQQRGPWDAGEGLERTKSPKLLAHEAEVLARKQRLQAEARRPAPRPQAPPNRTQPPHEPPRETRRPNRDQRNH